MTTDTSKNMWRNKGRLNFPINGLVLYAPLWHPELNTSPFISKDLNAHSCTVTGATWGIQGRTFDGSDDSITVPAAASIANIFDSGGTLEAWINPSSDGEQGEGRIFDKRLGWAFLVRAEAAGKVGLYFWVDFSTTDGTWASAAVVPINTFSHVVLTYDSSNVANDPVLIINGDTVAMTETLTPVGTRIDDSAIALRIGNAIARTTTFDGTIGEGIISRRIWSLGEAQNNFLSTKWRYQ